MDLLQEFFDPDKQYSVQAFWFLNGQLEPERLKEQIREMTEKGVYGGFLHPRAYLKTAYLEQPWWDAIDACMEAAKEYGFSPWLYDEYAWPSGTAGSTFDYGYQKPSRVLAEGEKNMAKGLYARKFTEKQNWQEFASDPKDQVFHVAEKDGMYYVFYCHVFEKAVDYMNPETIAQFIRLTHEEYSKRYQDKFGSLIPGIFFDEIFMTGNPIPWTKKLPDRFLEKYGYDLKDKLPSLIDGETEEDKQVRKDYFELITAMYEEAFFKQISDWCRDHDLKLIGHTEESLSGFPRRQGNYFDTMRHLMIPGSDCHDYRYTYPRKITCSEPKYAVSVARAYGKERAMSEALGGAGWNSRIEDLKRGINVLAAMGTNMFILHGFYYECEHQGSQSDWPTSFFYQNPYWKNFKEFADYIRRISFMNSAGVPVVQYGIFYPASDMQENMVNGEENERGKNISNAFHQTFHGMLEHQMDTDMIDERSILQAEISEGKLCVGVQKFQLLLLPKGTSLKEETKEKLISWIAQGGIVVFYETGASQDSDFLKDSPVCCPQKAAEAILQIMPPKARIVSGNWRDIYINHRKIEGKDCYLVVNGIEEKREIVLSFMESGVPVLLDPETGKTEKAVCEETPESCLVSLTLKEDQAVYLVFGLEQEKKTDAACQNKKTLYPSEEITAVTGKWDFLPLEKETQGNEAVETDTSRMEIVLADFSTDLQEDTQQIRICNQAGEEGRCGRHLSQWHGSWITRRPSWNDQFSAADLYFRKTIRSERKPKQLTMCLAAIDWAEVFLNGKQIYAGEANGMPVEITNSSALKEGDNLLAVHVRNHHPLADVYVCSVEELPKDRFISLLLEGWLETEKGRQLICSDSSWLVSDIEEEGWQELEDSKIRKNEHFDVQRVRKFYTEHAGHQWIFAWERGKPPILPWGELPLFGKLTDYPRKLYYSLKIPAGTVKIRKPAVKGNAEYRLNGKPVVWMEEWISIPKSDSVQHLTIEAEAKSSENGLKRPLEIFIEEHKVNPGDWRMDGLEDFSGRGRYRTFWTLEKQEGKRYILSLGQVCHCAELYINQKLADVRLWKPYEADITDYLTDGENEIVIIIANLASNERRHMLVDEGMALGWNRYWNEDNMDRDSQNYVSGLLGPIRLIARDDK